jgi:hypothetical protein
MFATVEEWAARPGNTMPEGAALLDLTERLERANRKVRRMTRSARYRHDVLGYPTDSAVADALRGAVLDQLAYSDATDPEGLGLGDEAVSVGPVTLGARAGTAGAGISAVYAPAAIERLIDAGLITGRVGY